MSMFNTFVSKGLYELAGVGDGSLARNVGHAALTFAAAGFARVGRAVIAEFTARRAMAQLVQMDERSLHDLGLVRCDVDRAVRRGRE